MTVEIEWLDNLETRVRDAVERLGELREENGTLRDRIEELETQLATFSTRCARHSRFMRCACFSTIAQ